MRDKEKKYISLILGLLLVIVILIIFVQKRGLEDNTNCDDNVSSNTDNISSNIDKYSFINDINSDNLICVFNSSLFLYRCDNIFKEEYNSFGDLIYINTANKEYEYSYLYDSYLRPIVMYNNSSLISLTYNDDDTISSIVYMIDNAIDKKIVYDYSSSKLPGEYRLPTKINVYDSTNKLVSYVTFEVNSDGGGINIEEKSYNSFKKNIMTRYYNYNDVSFTKLTFIFRSLNFMPEPYYSNNPFYNIAYKYVNYDSSLNNSFVHFVTNVEKIVQNDKVIEYYYGTDYSYDSEYNYIIFNTLQESGLWEPSLIVHKDDGKYFETKIELKEFKSKNYFEINEKVEISEEEYESYIEQLQS